MPPLTIWTNAGLPDDALAALRSGTAGHRLVFDQNLTGNLAAGGPSAELAGADVAFGQPDPDQLLSLPSIQWVHITSAGYTRYDRPDIEAASWPFTNSSSVFAEPCAQHVLAFMLSQARQIPQSLQASPNWAFDALRPATSVLQDQTVLILGFGAIAERLVQLLRPFRLDVVGVRRRVRGDEGVPTFGIDQLPNLLGEADHVVNILPASRSTDQLLAAEAFAKMKPGAIFYNIGRGSTVDQDALLGALNSGRVTAAYLDVTDPEPLPVEHSLWRAPNCYITPHIAGGFRGEGLAIVEHFLANLRRFEAGEQLLDGVFV